MDTRSLVTVLLLTLAVGFGSGAIVASFLPWTRGEAAAMQQQYYRGIYDICRMSGATAEECLGAVDKTRYNKWYDSRSEGWMWR